MNSQIKFAGMGSNPSLNAMGLAKELEDLYGVVMDQAIQSDPGVALNFLDAFSEISTSDVNQMMRGMSFAETGFLSKPQDVFAKRTSSSCSFCIPPVSIGSARLIHLYEAIKDMDKSQATETSTARVAQQNIKNSELSAILHDPDMTFEKKLALFLAAFVERKQRELEEKIAKEEEYQEAIQKIQRKMEDMNKMFSLINNMSGASTDFVRQLPLHLIRS